MYTSWPALRQLSTGEFLGAKSWLNSLARRDNWLYAQAHAVDHPFRQAQTGALAGNPVVWEGESTWRPEHPTLYFSAHIDGGTWAAIQYMNASGSWANLAYDGGTGARWFGGVQDVTYSLSGLSLPSDNMVHLRFYVGGPGYGHVYRAFMWGESGLTSWPTIPTFVDGTAPSAADLNTLRTAEQYLYERASRPNLGTNMTDASHSGNNPTYVPMFWYSFIYSGVQRLRLDFTTLNLNASTDHLYVYLNNEHYPDGGSRLATLLDYTTGGNTYNYVFNDDLSARGLTTGTVYQIEIGTYGGFVVVVNDLSLRDLGGVSRVNVPPTWAHGSHLTAAQLNGIASDLASMRDTASNTHPIWPHHWFTSYQPYSYDIMHYGLYTGCQRYRFVHRWRYLRYRGSGILESVARKSDGSALYTFSLPDTSPAGQLQTVDLDTVTWLGYGMEYWVNDSGNNKILMAFEDYA